MRSTADNCCAAQPSRRVGSSLADWLPAWAQTVSPGIVRPLPTLSGDDITLRIARQTMIIDGRKSNAIGINGTVPAPLIRLREGQKVRLNVVNDLDEDSSIHWHGLLVPPQFDGVPGVSFPGIKPRSTFLYEFPVRQYGHLLVPQPFGAAGAARPLRADRDRSRRARSGPIRPRACARARPIIASSAPHEIFRRMKVDPGHFNFQKQTLAGLLAGRDQTLEERLDWGRMRMDPTDMLDVTGCRLHLSRQRPRPARQLDRPVHARRARAAARSSTPRR